MTGQRRSTAAEPPGDGVMPAAADAADESPPRPLDPPHPSRDRSSELSTEELSEAAPGPERPRPDDERYCARIDGLLPEWTVEMVEALDAWQQGDLLRGSPLFWLAPAGADPVIGLGESTGQDRADGDSPPAAREEGAGAEGSPLALDAGTEDGGWFAITSQTCDVAAAGPGGRHPVVSVSPVYRMPNGTSPDRLTRIAQGAVVDLVRVTAPPGDGFYVVDLRVSLPVSKGLLLERSPIAAWLDEEDRLDFAEAVARKARRPALADVISKDMVDSLNTYIGTTSKQSPEWREKVSQVRLRISGGSRLRPTSVSLVVCCDAKLTVEERSLWRSWQKQGKRLLAQAGIALEPQLIQTMDELTARLYKDSVPLNLPALGRPPAW